ncbi:MAG TPA: small ribosomal subunit Rsm22 family protein [Polyangiaceae bacterium]|jgi:hypothetical protein
MIGLGLVRPLDDGWRETLDAVAERRGWPRSGDVAVLAARVAALSRSYNDPAVARASVVEAGSARLGFSFARDVPKGAGAVRELVACGLLRFGAAPLRLLDLGAGFGATTWGVLRALQAAADGARDEAARIVEATWIDADPAALRVGAEIAQARVERERAVLRVRGVESSVNTPLPAAIRSAGLHDLVVAGQVLSELDVDAPPPVRADRHAALLDSLLAHCVDLHGSLVVVEPALRDRTRHLHAVRDRMIARGATVFAPCLHAAPCPALARDTDWCHEDLPIDLPRWLVPVARAAGLRREGLTFSYLVLRKDGATLKDFLPAPSGSARLRIVSEAMRSKGKREVFVCGELGGDGAQAESARASTAGPEGRVRAVRLDRDERPENGAWNDLARGDVVVIDPALDRSRPRVGAHAVVAAVTAVAGVLQADDRESG